LGGVIELHVGFKIFLCTRFQKILQSVLGRYGLS